MPDNLPPPDDYEALIRLIHDRYDQMSRSYQAIALYLTQNPNEVAVHSVNAIAEKLGIHASSFVRFAQALGYSGFKDLQHLFQRRLATAAPGFEARLRAMRADLATPNVGSDVGILRELVAQDLSSIEALLHDIDVAALSCAADCLAKADAIYVLGQLRSEPVALLLRYMLTMLGLRAVNLDAPGGLATHMARAIRPADALLAVSFRFYANEVVAIVDETGRRGVPVIAITDSTLSPLAKSAKALLTVPERDHRFTRSISAPVCLAQALVVSVAARIQQGTAPPRVPAATEQRAAGNPTSARGAGF
jgi:DNA-binding MurR/RpiR family transcriptional regulator